MACIDHIKVLAQVHDTLGNRNNTLYYRSLSLSLTKSYQGYKKDNIAHHFRSYLVTEH